ncbi:MAG: metal ABC transporter substrate-binding protein [Alphaproteobacteria bacterium]|nr:metal ABC transporter substrate-binding protein [Alphaproteobacteria bacterium]
MTAAKTLRLCVLILPLLLVGQVRAGWAGQAESAQSHPASTPTSSPVPANPTRPLQVVVSFSILGDWVAQVGGDYVAVKPLIGANQDAHAFQPRPRDVQMIAAADLVVVNGLGFEGWSERLIHSANYRGAVVVASRGIQPLTPADDAHHHHHHGTDHDGDKHGKGEGDDPHAWHDPANAAIYVANIRDGLIARDPANADTYRTRAAAYLKQLADTTAWAKGQFAKLNPNQRRAITNHDAFQYLARAFDLHLEAPAGWSTDSQPSARNIARLIQQMRQRQVRTLFVENISDPRMVQQLAKEGGGTLGGKLYSDALDAPGTAAATYLGMMRSNVDTLIRGLTAPNGG